MTVHPQFAPPADWRPSSPSPAGPPPVIAPPPAWGPTPAPARTVPYGAHPMAPGWGQGPFPAPVAQEQPWRIWVFLRATGIGILCGLITGVAVGLASAASIAEPSLLIALLAYGVIVGAVVAVPSALVGATVLTVLAPWIRSRGMAVVVGLVTGVLLAAPLTGIAYALDTELGAGSLLPVGLPMVATGVLSAIGGLWPARRQTVMAGQVFSRPALSRSV